MPRHLVPVAVRNWRGDATHRAANDASDDTPREAKTPGEDIFGEIGLSDAVAATDGAIDTIPIPHAVSPLMLPVVRAARDKAATLWARTRPGG